MIWLARFTQIASGLIVAISAHESSMIGAMLGWMLSTVVPTIYHSADLRGEE